MADFTYCPTWAGMVYVAFVSGVFARRILGWRAATAMTTPLVLDCLEQAICTRRCEGTRDLAGLVHHTDAGSQYTSRFVHQPPGHHPPVRRVSARLTPPNPTSRHRTAPRRAPGPLHRSPTPTTNPAPPGRHDTRNTPHHNTTSPPRR